MSSHKSKHGSAVRYILDPLTEPEPSQETGPGSSHVHYYRLAGSSGNSDTSDFSVYLSSTPPRSQELVSSRNKSPSAASSCYSSHSASPTTTIAHLKTEHPTQGSGYDDCLAYGSDYEEYSLQKVSPHTRHVHPASSRAVKKSRGDAMDCHEFGTAFTPRSPHDASRTSALVGAPSIDYAGITSSPAGLSTSSRPRSLSPNMCGLLTNGSSSHPSDLPRSPLAGDMSDRPLDKIRADALGPERRQKSRKRTTHTDYVDRFDTVSSPYHHGGPYDAASPCRNRYRSNSPLAAVQDSNMEALRATPRANLIDTLTHNLPLQGTASLAPGDLDTDGKIMEYTEGTDLMRDEDAPGGAYKRWADIPYDQHDLKGKGEPSFSIERDLKSKKRQKHASVQSAAPETSAKSRARPRPISALVGPVSANDALSGKEPRRSHTTGKKLGEGIRRRFEGWRRKQAPINT